MLEARAASLATSNVASPDAPNDQNIRLTILQGAHYGDVIMGAMVSQITSLTIVYSTVDSYADQRKHQSSASVAFGNSTGTGEFPAEMASNAETVSIWWRHHGVIRYLGALMWVKIR